jgi:hypothetical protein
VHMRIETIYVQLDDNDALPIWFVDQAGRHWWLDKAEASGEYVLVPRKYSN